MVVKTFYLTDIAVIERANSSTEYPAGTVYVQVSASSGQTGITKRAERVEGRYAVIIPKINIYPPYFKIAIDRAMPKFLERNQTTINIQMDAFRFFEIEIHEDIRNQIFVVNACRIADEAMEAEEKLVRQLQTVKKIGLAKMFPDCIDKPLS